MTARFVDDAELAYLRRLLNQQAETLNEQSIRLNRLTRSRMSKAARRDVLDGLVAQNELYRVWHDINDGIEG